MKIFLWIYLSLVPISQIDCLVYRDEIPVVNKESDELSLEDDAERNPLGPLIYCQYLPSDFYQCESIEDVPENETRSCQKRNGRRFGGERHSEVEHQSIICQVYDGIQCIGNRTFVKSNIPCIKYTSHHFLSTLFYSIFLGIFAVDRYALGHIGIGVGKMITLGGLGLWWIIDIILLIYGKLMPADDSNWIIQH